MFTNGQIKSAIKNGTLITYITDPFGISVAAIRDDVMEVSRTTEDSEIPVLAANPVSDISDTVQECTSKSDWKHVRIIRSPKLLALFADRFVFNPTSVKHITRAIGFNDPSHGKYYTVRCCFETRLHEITREYDPPEAARSEA